MNVRLTEDQEAFVRKAVEAGRYSGEEAVVREALSLWEEQERRRTEVLASVDQAEASLQSGEGRRIRSREDLTLLAGEIKRRGAARLSGESPH
jgi:putative addiction module CopG family antidote